MALVDEGKISAKAVRSLGADIIRKFTESVAEVISAFLSPTHTPNERRDLGRTLPVLVFRSLLVSATTAVRYTEHKTPISRLVRLSG